MLITTTRRFDKEDLAYFAGLLDGEGTFTVVVTNRKSRLQLASTMCFAMKSRALVEWAKARFGGLTYSRNVGDMYAWRLNRLDDLMELIPQLLPYLKAKRQQAEVLLEFVEHRVNDIANKGQYHSHYDAKCYELALKVRSLNGNNKPII